MTQHSSSTKATIRTRHLALSLIAAVAIALPALGSFGALVTTDRYIVTSEAVVTEDQYVTSVSSIVEGTIDGDLTVFTGSLTVSGEITGSVTVFSSGTVTIAQSGRIGGSLNGSALALSMDGTVGSDVFFTAGSVVVEDHGSVGRDLLAFGGTARVDGTVDRDLRGRSYRTTIDGSVGGDVDIAAQSLSIAGTGSIGGDLVYRSAADATIAEGATITGTVTKLPTQSNFVYGLILSLANVVGFLGFVVAGLAALWLFRGSGARAVGAIVTRPIRSLLAGLAVAVVAPLATALLAVTLVGIPLALITVALAMVAFIVGAVPAVTALGNRILLNRGGLFGAFVVGAVLWRLGIWLIPYVGGFLFVLGLIWGLGGWILGIAATRRSDPIPAALIPAALVAGNGAPEGWEPPRAPGRPVVADDGAATTSHPGAAAAVIADEVVTPTREQTAISPPGPRGEAAGRDHSLGEGPAGTQEAPDPARERDSSHEIDTISFAREVTPSPPQVEDDAGDDEPHDEVPSRGDGGTSDDVATPEPGTEAPGPGESKGSLEERLAALRRELDEAEAAGDQPFSEFFKQKGDERQAGRAAPREPATSAPEPDFQEGEEPGSD